MPGKNETTEQFQKREFPQRIKNVERRTADVLSKTSRASEGEKARARKARKAAGRVKRRLGISDEPKKKEPEKSPGKSLLEGIGGIFKFFKGLTAEEKKNLEKVQEGIPKG